MKTYIALYELRYPGREPDTCSMRVVAGTPAAAKKLVLDTVWEKLHKHAAGLIIYEEEEPDDKGAAEKRAVQ